MLPSRPGEAKEDGGEGKGTFGSGVKNSFGKENGGGGEEKPQDGKEGKVGCPRGSHQNTVAAKSEVLSKI